MDAATPIQNQVQAAMQRGQEAVARFNAATGGPSPVFKASLVNEEFSLQDIVYPMPAEAAAAWGLKTDPEVAPNGQYCEFLESIPVYDNVHKFVVPAESKKPIGIPVRNDQGEEIRVDPLIKNLDIFEARLHQGLSYLAVILGPLWSCITRSCRTIGSADKGKDNECRVFYSAAADRRTREQRCTTIHGIH